jgi:hypothetical protein
LEFSFNFMPFNNIKKNWQKIYISNGVKKSLNRFYMLMTPPLIIN